jgi:hypothetical protein
MAPFSSTKTQRKLSGLERPLKGGRASADKVQWKIVRNADMGVDVNAISDLLSANVVKTRRTQHEKTDRDATRNGTLDSHGGYPSRGYRESVNDLYFFCVCVYIKHILLSLVKYSFGSYTLTQRAF